MASCPAKRREGGWRGALCRCLPCAVVLVVIPMPARAFELSGGVNLGVMLAGTIPRIAVTPNAGISWRTESGVLFAAHDHFSILPATSGAGAGVYNQTSAAVGYATKTANFSVGPSLSIYSMLTCGVTWCGRVVGVAPGGHAQVSVYFAGPLGVSLSANLDWIGGRSIVLPGGVAATVVAGPIVRWGPR